MKQKFGIAASHVDIVFRKDGADVFCTKGTMGCLRRGEPEDSYALVRHGLAQMERAILEGKTDPDARAFDTVAVGRRGRVFSHAELVRARVIDAPARIICKGLDPKKKKKGPKPRR